VTFILFCDPLPWSLAGRRVAKAVVRLPVLLAPPLFRFNISRREENFEIKQQKKNKEKKRFLL